MTAHAAVLGMDLITQDGADAGSLFFTGRIIYAERPASVSNTGMYEHRDRFRP